MKDINGRPYATVADLKAGDFVELDGDFTCAEPYEIKRVEEGPRSGLLYFKCREGRHLLEGQLSDDGTYYVGVYRVEVPVFSTFNPQPS